MSSSEIKELHDMIAHAVREGILSACEEMNGNADRTTTEDAFENAKAYCVRLKSRFVDHPRLNSKSSTVTLAQRVSDSVELVREMKELLTEQECRYVLTHIHEVVGQEYSTQADAFVDAYVW
jgi:hypothetical protein